MKFLSKKLMITITVLTILFLAFLPCILPPNYHSLSERKRLIVETAVKSAFRHLDEGVYLLTLRLDYVDMFVNPRFKHHMLKGIAWEVRLRGYTFFYIPLCEVRVFVDNETLKALCGSIRPAGYQWPEYGKS